MMKRSNVESREFRAGRPATVADGEGWQDWPADDSDWTPMVFAPIRPHPRLGTVRLSIVASFDAGDRSTSTEEIVVSAALDESAPRDRTAALQWFTLAVATAAAIAVFTVVSADAQETVSAVPTPGRIIEAPIGHRQPHEWQLPRKVQRDEGHRTGQQIDFDKQLQICRGCE